MRPFTVKLLLGALVLTSTHANAQKVLLDAHWKVVKDEKQAQYYLKQSTEVIDGHYKAEVYYKNKDMLFCASALADNNIGKTLTSEQFAMLINVILRMASRTNKAFVTNKANFMACLKNTLPPANYIVSRTMKMV